MGGRHAVWLLVLPLAAVGWLSAHSLACALVAPDAHERARMHSEAGHGYLATAAPVVVASAGTLLLVGLALAIGDGLRGRGRSRLPGWPVALVPPLGFAVQEHLERWIAANALPVDAALEPAFLAGIALQLPFALAALLVARAVLVLGHELGRALPAPRSPRASARPIALNPLDRLEPELVRPPILGTGRSERGPPGGAAVSPRK
jgi:hypothetical protein